jgi:hypothetical protein
MKEELNRMKIPRLFLMLILILGSTRISCDSQGEVDPSPQKEDPLTTSEQGKFIFDSWASWNNFEKGAWVSFEVEEVNGRKFLQKKTLQEKGEGVVKGVIELNGVAFDQTLAQKPTGESSLSSEGSDGIRIEWSRENLKVGDNDLLCEKMLSQGKDEEVTEVWYSRVVPGWVVKRRTPGMVMTCTGYGTR